VHFTRAGVHSLLFPVSCSSRPLATVRLLLASLAIATFSHSVIAQQTNPVDRKVTNPMTDTPNVNPLNPDQSVQRPPTRLAGVPGTATDELSVDAT
jgi:hypothetical protein